MRTRFALTALVCLAASPSFAQTSSSTSAGAGVGIGVANSDSRSGAVAISGQGGAGGQGGVGTVNIAGTPSQQSIDTRTSGDVTSRVISSGTTTSNQNLSGTTTSNINQTGGTTNRVITSGTSTVRTAPSMVAPGLAAAGLETCLGSASGTVSAIGFGIGGGSTYADEGCQARLDSRTLYAYGLKAAAVARLCQRADIWRAMPDMCARYWPEGVPYPNGIVIAAPVGRANVVMSTGEGAPGSIRVVDGRDGVEKDCLNYSEAKHKCYQWAGQPHRVIRTAAVNPQKTLAKPKPVASKPPLPPAVPASNDAVKAIESATEKN